MIQRIQSIYLSMVFILGILYFFIPYANFYIGDVYVADINAYGVFSPKNIRISSSINMILLVINLATINLLAIFTIFLFKNRSLQSKLIKINMLFVIVLMAGMFLFGNIIKTTIKADVSYWIAAAFPILSLVFLYLALRGVNKDEELVKAADRLR